MKTSLLLSCLLLACQTASAPDPGRRGPAETPTRADAEPPAPEPAAPDVEAVGLRRAMHLDMRDVVLDPTGTAALTFGRDGGVRLWDDIQTEQPAEPWVMPFEEPLWAAVGRAGDGFVVAHIDTANAGHVGRVESGTYRPLFEIPADDPLFELRVLDGGKRILALGIDHRVRLYDDTGTVLSVLDERGFIPWQLRVEGSSILAVLARPVGAQRIGLKNDKLTIEGEARQVALDQSPNRNDLALSPDGKTIGALRRPKSRGTTWWLELIDVDTGARKKITGDADTTMRPRLHLLDGNKALLYAGTAAGQLVDLAQAVEVPAGEEPPAPATFAGAIEAVRVELATDEARFHSTAAGGVRASAQDDTLVVHRLDQKKVYEHRAQGMAVRRAGLSPDGTTVVWASVDRVYRETIGTGKIDAYEAAPSLVDFIDDERLLLVEEDGTVTIRSAAEFEVLARRKVELSRGVFSARYLRRADGTGTVGIVSRRFRDPLQLVEVDGATLGEIVTDDGSKWPLFDSGKPAKVVPGGVKLPDMAAVEVLRVASDGRGKDFAAGESSGHPKLFMLGDGRAEAMTIRAGRVQELVAHPTAPLLAVVQHVSSERRLDAEHPSTVSVYDTTTNERLWTRGMDFSRIPAFSADGTRLVFGGTVVQARTGAIVHRRQHLGLASTFD